MTLAPCASARGRTPRVANRLQNVHASRRRRGHAAQRLRSRAKRDTLRSMRPTSPVPSEENAERAPRRRAPGVLLHRLSGPLNALLACGIARRAEENVIELLLDPREVETGGMVSISMRVPVRCPACSVEPLHACLCCKGTGRVEDLFNAWLAVPPGVSAGTALLPSALLPGMIDTVIFRVCLDT